MLQNGVVFMQDYNAELSVLREKLARKEKVEAILCNLHAQQATLQAEEKQLAIQRAKEQDDVNRLEIGSLATFFYAVIQKKEEKLDKEKAEAYAVAVKHDAVCYQLQTIERAIQPLEAELSTFAGTQTAYNHLLATKRALLKVEKSAFGEELCQIEAQLDHLISQQREVHEALSAGQDVLSRISDIENDLNSAEHWGAWDMMGGGFLSTYAKHSCLDAVQSQINDLQSSLYRYHSELTDITIQANIEVQIDGFLRFADYFFDGLFADWAVLNSIHSSQQQISSTRMQVESIQRKLSCIESSAIQTQKALNERMQELVLQA